MLALEAGSAAGGDRRCTPETTALSAYIEVAGPTDELGRSSLRIVLNYTDDTTGVLRFLRQLVRPEGRAGSENPMLMLREGFEVWRSQQINLPPCQRAPEGARREGLPGVQSAAVW